MYSLYPNLLVCPLRTLLSSCITERKSVPFNIVCSGGRVNSPVFINKRIVRFCCSSHSIAMNIVDKSHSCNVAATAAAAKSLQSCPTLCDPIDGSPPGSPIPGILQARTLEWVAISFSNT